MKSILDVTRLLAALRDPTKWDLVRNNERVVEVRLKSSEELSYNVALAYKYEGDPDSDILLLDYGHGEHAVSRYDLLSRRGRTALHQYQDEVFVVETMDACRFNGIALLPDEAGAVMEELRHIAATYDNDQTRMDRERAKKIDELKQGSLEDQHAYQQNVPKLNLFLEALG